MHNSRIANYNRVVWHIKINIAVRCNKYIIANFNVAYDNGINYDINIVAYFRGPNSFPSVFTANGTALMQINIVAQFCFTCNSYVIGMS